MNDPIPFTKPAIFGDEIDNLAQVLENGHLSGNGPYTRQCENWLQETLGAPRACLTHSCTAALEMAALLLDLGPGDEVILPSFTFSSTANAIALTGATPVFADSEIQTLNIDPEKIAPLITPATRAIFVVHYAGLPPDMDRINEIATKHGLIVVEDAAQSLGSSYKGQPAGTHSALSTFSFHQTKNIVAGEGGALVINDPAYMERAEIIREKGTNRQAFLQGQVDKYTWVDIGSSYLPSEFIAAFLASHLPRTEQINARRKEICARYFEALQPYEGASLRLGRQAFGDAVANGHIFYGLLETAEQRQQFIRLIREQGIVSVFHFLPLHCAPAGKKFGRAPDGCPVCEDFAARLFRLPVYFSMDDAEVSRVIKATIVTLEKLFIKRTSS